MKIFYAVLGVFLLLLAGVAINAVYVHRVAGELNARVDAIAALPCSESYASALELSAYWRRHRNIAGLSVSYTVIDRVSETAESLVAAAEAGDVFGRQQAIAMLRDAVEDLERLETFSIGNLF